MIKFKAETYSIIELGGFKFTKVPFADLTQLKAGRMCYPASYCLLTSDNCVLFFKSYWSSPQCNQSLAIAKRLFKHCIDVCPGLSIVSMPVPFLPHNCSEYV
jgi:hypothetical protein